MYRSIVFLKEFKISSLVPFELTVIKLTSLLNSKFSFNNEDLKYEPDLFEKIIEILYYEYKIQQVKIAKYFDVSSSHICRIISKKRKIRNLGSDPELQGSDPELQGATLNCT